MEVWLVVQSLLLLILANGAPIVAKKVLASRLAFPLDGGTVFLDDRPLLGPSKTVRGIVVSVATTAAIAPLLGVSVAVGALVAGLAMIGDLLSSFVKRRLGLRPSAQAIGLDQVPESLLPLLVCRNMLSLTLIDVAATVVIFLVGELIVSRLLYVLRVRDQPY